MTCPNKSTDWFRAIMEHYHLSDDSLGKIIHKYWIQNGNEDSFPSDVYINAEMGKGQYTEPSEDVINIWKKYYANPIEVSTTEELAALKEKAEKVFPASAIKVYKNDKDNFVLTVKEPVRETKPTIKTFLDKDSYTSQEYADFRLITGTEDLQFKIENTPKPADQMNRRELWEHLESLAESMGERSVSYTPIGKTRQQYIVKDGKVYNKKGEEVHYQGKDINRILANLAVAEDRGVVVTYKDKDYVVDNHQNITSVTSGDIMKWKPQDGNRKAIIQLAEQKFKTLIENRQNRLSEMVPELMDLLKAQDINIHDKAAMEKFLKENPQWPTKIQQAIEENREMQTIKEKAIADDTFMKAPNGNDTNLTERQWLQVRTKNFINWFGDWINDPANASKVVDENGEPFVAYTGTTGDFTVFDSKYSRTASKGFFFTVDRNVASSEGKIKEVFLNIRNLKEEDTEAPDFDTEDGKYDSVSYIYKGAEAFVVWNPNQIKSATDNNGIFSTENDDIQMMIRPYSKKHPYRNKVKATEQQRTEILGFIKSKEYNNNGTDIVTLKGDNHQYVYVVDHSSHKLLEENQKENEKEGITTDLFGIRKKFDIKKLTENDIRYIARNIAGDYGGSETSIQHRMQELGITTEQLPGIDIDAAIQRGVGDYGKMVTETGEVGEQTIYDRSSIDSGENQTILPEGQRLETSEGEIYGFADQKGNLYFDEEKVSPNVQIHEYTHLWDRAVAQRNPKLWKRGVNLMKQTSLWNEVLNDANYGQKWKTMKGITSEKMESLIASEVHSRLVGTQGETLFNRIAKEQGSKGIVAKLKQWMLDFWKELKGTFSNWSDEEINNLTLDDFNKMTVRDLIDKVNLKEQQQAQQPTQQATTSEEDLTGPLTKEQAETVQQKLGSIGELNQKINNLYESNLLPTSEVLHVAELIMNSITDDVTRLQKEPGLAKQWFPSLSTKLNFQNATRKEIIEAVGINRLIQAAKKNFDSSEHEYDDIETEFQADLITDNWDAIVSFGTKIFAMNEGFGIKMDYKNGGYVLANGMKLGFDDLNDQQDIDSIREQVGDEQEHWQIEQRTLDILNNASEIVRMAIHDCYKIGKDGKPVVNKWGIKERMNPREAITSILAWTQGALTIDDMVNMLMDKQIEHPWLSQLTDKLRIIEGQENPNADFQSQFFTTMCRSHQSYSIVLLDNGKYAAVPVNDHPSLTEIMQSISAQFRIKEHPLFKDKDGRDKINEELLGSENTKLSDVFNLHKADYELKKIAQDLSNGEELSADMLDKAKDNLSEVLKTLGYTPSEEILDSILNVDTIQEMAKYTGYIVDSLDDALKEQKKGKTYDPFGFKSKNGIAGTLRNLLTPVTNAIDEIVPNVVYDDGKLYQAYVTPSYLTLLFEKFHWEDAKFKEFIEKEYGYSEWFKYANSGDEGWRGGWLKMLATDKASRDLFAHTVELNFNKRRYMRNMTDAEYTVSLFTHYFAENTEGKDSMVPAWFRVPIQSNKPSSEFIRFWSYRGESYKTNIVEGMYEMFLQEVNRIQTVRMRNLTKDRPGFIKSFDENGRKFCFLPYLNDYLSEGKKGNRTLLSDKDGISAEKRNEKLANYLQNIEKLSTVENDSEMRSLVMEAIQNYMQQKADEILHDYEKKGLIEAAKTIKDIYPETLKSKEEQTAWVRNQLENFIWNDYYAANNILQLTLGDKAASKDADEMQKRLAQLHAPGIRANIKATDYEGNRVSDGTYRTIILKDFEMLKSNIIENLTEYFNREIEKATAEQKEAWKAIKEDLVGKNGKFREINVVDGQGYSSPSSYRKKALMFGRWSKQAEKIYQNLKNDDFTMEDIETAFQPLKPFVYSQLHKDMSITNAPITKMPIPFQAKNSEYLLIMADALLQGKQTGRPNMLRAIYRVMEDSELLNPTKGIDTVQFESAIKSGLQGAVDINQFMYEENGEEKAYAYLTNLIYKKDAEGAQTKEYDIQNFVHEASYEGYCLQQEVPEHFRNHNQAHGSQERMIIPSDLVAAINGETVYYEWTDPDGTKRKATAEEFGREYENTIAENIDESIKQLRAELKLDSPSKKERNLALSEILQKEILDSSRYGIDMFLACGLDSETGDFRVPLGDPIQAKRIEQLLNSIIKNRVNKQEIAGGPIVQVTNWGTSKQLHIRFKDKDSGELLMTEEEYNKAGESQYISYKDYLKHRQGGIAYFEVYAPAWSKDLYQKFMDKDGNIDIGAIEILNPDLLKMISYRIPTEDKYSIAPMKVVGFMPERAGSAIMFPYELTEIDDSDFDVDKRYVMRKVIEIGTKYEIKENENATEAEKDYIKHNKKSITQYLQKAVNIQGKTTAEEREAIEKEAKAAAEVDKRTAKRAHEERLATIERRNAMMEEVEAQTEFSKDAEKSDEIYDKRVDKQEKWYDKAVAREEQRYQIELDKIDARTNETISKEITRLENKKASERINQFLTIDRWNNSSQDDALTRQLRIAYLRYVHPTYEETSGKIANDNKIIDMSWGVLTHEAIASQLLNPGGFDNLKKIGYQIAAFKDPKNTKSWEELGKMSVSELQDLHHSTKDLAWVDTQVEYYRQNAAAASLIGIFAVNKIAHAMLERDHLQIDTKAFFDQPFEIELANGTMKRFEDMMDVDPSFDKSGKRIGKTLGSGVSASADAAKTPALHLMNVNLNTVNIFTTLLRLGLPEETAGLFCSQNVISEVLDEFNKKNLNNYEPIANIIEQRLLKLREKESIAEDSNINTESLSREELIEGLKDTQHPETDYKVLLTFQKIRNLSDAMRKPTFATRFNSISSAVGPQIIDNLILEHKMEQFGQDGNETGFYDRDGNPVTINDIFEMHPALRAFAETVKIAKGLFMEMPTGSNSFRNLLTKLPASIADTIYNDKKLLSDLSNFYQSYLLIREGLIDESKLKYYIEKFPKEFMEKDANGKSLQDRYPDNALIQNIKLISSKKTGRSFLTIKLTGEDETTKDIYRTAWIDLHKKNPELSQKLFNYFFFRAGIGFSPKTGMALVTTFVKERLSTKSNDKEITYSDVYRKLPTLNRILEDQFKSELDEGEMVLDQFIRNNWNESKLVPKKGGEGTNYKVDLNAGRLVAFTESDVADLKGVTYMRTYQNGQTYLWKLIGNESDKENQKHRTYRRIKPLGDNNEYLEMSTKDIAKPYSETTLDIEDSDTSELQSKSPSESSAEQQVPVTPSDNQITLTMELVEKAIAAQWETNGIMKSKEEVKKRARSIKGREKQDAKFVINGLNKLGINISEEDFIREFKKLC